MFNDMGYCGGSRMIATLPQLMLNHHTLDADGKKLFTEAQVRMAAELGRYEPVKQNDMKTNAHEWGPELARMQVLENQAKEQQAQIAQITKVIGELTDKVLGLAVATRMRFERGQNHV